MKMDGFDKYVKFSLIALAICLPLAICQFLDIIFWCIENIHIGQ